MVSGWLPGVNHLALPVDAKNPLTAFFCARKIARLAAREKVQLLHAHSRVPAWTLLGCEDGKNSLCCHRPRCLRKQTAWIYHPIEKPERLSASVPQWKRNEGGVLQRQYKSNPQRNAGNGLCMEGPCGRNNSISLYRAPFSRKGDSDIMEILPLLQGGWTLDVVGDGRFSHAVGKNKRTWSK